MENKNWQPADICLVIMTVTIPMIIIVMAAARALTHEQIPPENAALMADILKVLCGGVLGVIGSRVSKQTSEKP